MSYVDGRKYYCDNDGCFAETFVPFESCKKQDGFNKEVRKASLPFGWLELSTKKIFCSDCISIKDKTL